MKTIKHLTNSLVFILALFSTSVFAQAPANTAGWQSFGPTGEEFSVIMPKDPVFESGKMPYHKMELNTRLYMSGSASGPVFAIVSLSGIKSNPAMYSEMERLNSYVDAFKKFLVPRLKGKDAIGKLTLTKSKKLNGHDGREYQLTIAELSGPVHVYSTRKRFYAIAFLNSKKDETLSERFISSFILPEKTTQSTQPTETAAAQPAQPEVAASNSNPNEPNKPKTHGGQGTDGESEGPVAVEAKPADTKGAPGEKKPISGGVLNSKAISLPLPAYPPEAKASGASGAVTVQVTIDEYGNVINATATSGHILLQQTAVAAAYQARFSPTTLMGEPVKVVGMLVYNFVAK